MTLLRKSYSPGIEGGGIPDEVRIEKAYQLLVKKSKEAYLSSGSFSASPFGLDGIPHVRRDAISKLMVEFSDSELSFVSEELSRLKEENERLRGEGDFSKINRFEVINHGSNVLEKGRVMVIRNSSNGGSRKISVQLQDDNKTLKVFID